MDRTIVYPGAIPLDTDLLTLNRNTMVALGYLAQATLGTSTVVDGLACTPTVPSSMSVTVGPGSITAFTVVDQLAYGSLPADAADPLVKMGVNLTPTTFTLTAPATSGQAIDYLIEAAFGESDADPAVLPYYNAANPAQPFAGANNSGAAQNTARIARVQLQLKPGTPANAGAQTAPAVDQGWVGLYVITVNYGQTVIPAGNITPLPGAPFVSFKLPQLAPGVSRMAVLTNSAVWAVPAGVTQVRARIWGAGGAGGAGGGTCGGGGAGGGYAEGYFAVTPGQAIPVTVGAGAATSGAAGASSSFGGLVSATGGNGGSAGSAGAVGAAGNAPGMGGGSGLLLPGTGGQNGLAFGGSGGFGSAGLVGGAGGAGHAGGPAFGPAGSNTSTIAGANGNFPGGGGSGGIGTGAGGAGAAGLVVLEW